MSFPTSRPRRLRATDALRRQVRETRLSPDNFIAPLFVVPGEGVRREIGAMPGCHQTSVDELLVDCRELDRVGVPAVILFGLPASKDPEGSGAHAEDGPVPTALPAVRCTRGRAGSPRSTTTARCPSSRRPPWPTPRPAPTSWPPPT